MSNQNGHANQKTVDYDIFGVVGIRLINPTEKDAAAVVNQLGPAHAPLQREPDIVIRFHREMKIPDLIFLGLNSAGYNEDGFYILRSDKANCKARIPFEDIGNKQLVIDCESGLRAVPLLIALTNLAFLSKRYLPLHASAYLYNGVANMVTGWAKGGKTEGLLSFANHGAAYIADEWTIIAEGGEEMFGIAEPIRLWDWQFKHIPHVQHKIKAQKKMLFKGIHTMDAVGKTFSNSPLRKTFPVKLLNEALPAFKRQLNVRLQPHDIFQDRFCKSAPLDKIFLIMSHDSPAITVKPFDPLAIAEMMISSNEYEHIPLLEHYRAFTFAFPELRNSFLDNMRDLQAELIRKAFKGREAYQVLHPYPVDFEPLYQAMKPYCETKPKAIVQ